MLPFDVHREVDAFKDIADPLAPKLIKLARPNTAKSLRTV